jgi:hypothetical protein
MQLFLLLFPLFVSAQSLEGKWNGSYFYEAGRPGVHFLAEFKESGNNFQGTITEPNTFAAGGSASLRALVDGRRDGNRIRFEKTYDGGSDVNHTVDYQGIYQNGRISGEWRLGEAKGSFEMMRKDSDLDPETKLETEPKKTEKKRTQSKAAK